ncbi:DUF2625 family protein [Nocardia puris]|uniref:DUF2625 family protein n=1 Tax=Nocardia puris TaxID=208602 RepID=UPI0018DB7246|nr:DUF2625 family protein [Nocardia puris]
MSTVRPVEDLIHVDDPAWPGLRSEIASAAIPITVLPIEPAQGQSVLFRLQVTAWSTLGALALHTGGIVAEHGWLRILGGGYDGLPDLATANGMGEPGGGAPGALTVAVDALGGRFAVNGGALPGEPGEICYFGPETLRWEPIGGGHSAFLSWVLSGGHADFYEGMRWPGWAGEVGRLRLDQGLSVVPPLWSAEGRAGIAAADRRPVPIGELLALHTDIAAQLG